MTPGSPCETLAEEERLAWWAVEEYEVVMAEERLREDKELRENLRCIIFYSLYIYIYIYIYIYHPRTGRPQRLLPHWTNSYFTAAGKKIMENCRCILPNFMNDSFI